MSSRSRFNRRHFVNLTAAASASSLLTNKPAKAASKDNAVIQENSKPGTAEWQLQFHHFDDPVTLASYPLNRRVRHSAIEGYASKTSGLAGETIDLMVSMPF